MPLAFLQAVIALFLMQAEPSHSSTATPAAENPDLDVSVYAVSPENVLLTGEELSIRVLVANLGPGISGATELQYLISADPTMGLDDELLGTAFVPELTAGSSQSTMWRGKVTQKPGIYWIGACVASAPSDHKSANDCSQGFQFLVPNIDIQATYFEIRPARIISGVPVVMRAAVNNSGQTDSPPSRVRYVLSMDATISGSDRLLTTMALPSIEPGARWADPVKLKVAANPGVYWLGACVDPVPGESSTTNNCSQGSQISVLKDEFPELSIPVLKVRPETWSENESVDFYAEILNSGSRPSLPTKVLFYLSENPDITDGDFSIGSTDIDVIEPDSRAEAYLYIEPPVYPGTYWFGACVEPDENEFDTFNNCTTGPQVEVTQFTFSQ